MLFEDVVGQHDAKSGLLAMWAANTLPHAMLILGAEGSGGLPLGIALAQFIFCENRSAADACGVCPSCSKVARLEHADLHLSFPSIRPDPKKKAMSRHYLPEFREFVKQTPYGTTFEWLQHIDAENKQGNITSEECREIIDVLNLKTYEGRSKVLLMWRPEYLGKEGNILLKLIEEPPANTFLIFIAEQADDILATIKSRTQTIRLAPLSVRDIAHALTARTGVDDIRAMQVAHLAMGNYNEALALLRSADNDLFPAVRNLFNSLFTNKGVELAKFVEEWSKTGREQQKNLLAYIIHLLGFAVRARYTGESDIPLPEAEARFVFKLSTTKVSIENFDAMVHHISDTIYRIERNAHAKTQLHALMIHMHHAVTAPAVAAKA
jgi:DNA polymerase III subunit delta'